MMLPTSHRERLSKDFSYPLGAEVVSDALLGVPQWDTLSLAFRWWREPGVVTAATAGREVGPQPVLIASYRNLPRSHGASRALMQEGFYDPDWAITIYGVLRESRSMVRSLLLSDGLPRLRAWLSQPKDEVWLVGRRWFRLDFRRSDEALHASTEPDSR